MQTPLLVTSSNPHLASKNVLGGFFQTRLISANGPAPIARGMHTVRLAGSIPDSLATVAHSCDRAGTDRSHLAPALPFSNRANQAKFRVLFFRQKSHSKVRPRADIAGATNAEMQKGFIDANVSSELREY
jgi:hypothetical protein